MKSMTLRGGPSFASPVPFVLFGSFIVAALIASTGMSSSTALPGSKEVVVTEKDDGKSKQLARDSVLVVKLESQLGTGYGWEIEKTDERLLKSVGPPAVERPEKQAPGAREFQVFKFAAKEAGALVLRLRYVRPWEKPPKPTKTFTLKITIGS